jgi:hypothetical protein
MRTRPDGQAGRAEGDPRRDAALSLVIDSRRGGPSFRLMCGSRAVGGTSGRRSPICTGPASPDPAACSSRMAVDGAAAKRHKRDNLNPEPES